MTIEHRLEALGRRLPKLLRLRDADFLFFPVSNREMNKIKRTLVAREDFRGKEARKIKKEKMVNVLSFPEPEYFPHPEGKKKMLGEVYLNLDYALVETRGTEGRGRNQLSYEILGFLLIHGFLHLLGYRHDGKSDTIRMQRLEQKLCRAFKIPPRHSEPWDRTSS